MATDAWEMPPQELPTKRAEAKTPKASGGPKDPARVRKASKAAYPLASIDAALQAAEHSIDLVPQEEEGPMD
ncbi:MAG: hypothetical protein SGJ20_15250, partial [Planctomycetota bacterium]|nr:hypothetical protein [Planctomycetota bacterium]